MGLALLSIGSNVSPREHFLKQAIIEISNLGEINAVASLYESEPYGETDQPNFLNSALSLTTGMPPQRLLDELKSIEGKVGRQKRYRWGPREIDIDIIFYDNQIVTTRNLTIPHVDYHNRIFVLMPLSEIMPDFIAVNSGDTLKEMLTKHPDHNQISLYKSHWMENDN
ncbi:MAG: 2-amino-4-hydroxy-6-hydroxymethyldihydropteridine diphosphokinase [Calditrichota bacterium]